MDIATACRLVVLVPDEVPTQEVVAVLKGWSTGEELKAAVQFLSMQVPSRSIADVDEMWSCSAPDRDPVSLQWLLTRVEQACTKGAAHAQRKAFADEVRGRCALEHVERDLAAFRAFPSGHVWEDDPDPLSMTNVNITPSKLVNTFLFHAALQQWAFAPTPTPCKRLRLPLGDANLFGKTLLLQWELTHDPFVMLGFGNVVADSTELMRVSANLIRQTAACGEAQRLHAAILTAYRMLLDDDQRAECAAKVLVGADASRAGKLTSLVVQYLKTEAVSGATKQLRVALSANLAYVDDTHPLHALMHQLLRYVDSNRPCKRSKTGAETRQVIQLPPAR
jgi:hypothetical protein